MAFSSVKKIPKWALVIFIAVPFIVDAALNVFGMTILVFDPLFKISFGLIGVMNVIFVLISLAIDKKILYWLFVILVTFFDLSFSIEAVKQSESNNVTAENDTELIRLLNEQNRINIRIDRLMTEHEKMTKPDNLRANEEQQRVEQASLAVAKSQYSDRLKKIESGEISKYRITADSVIMAIPNAIADGKILMVIIFLWIFALLQIMIYLSMRSFEFHGETIPKKNFESIVTQWVKISWYNVRARRNNELISKETFFNLLRDREKLSFTDDDYDRCLSAALAEKLVDTVEIMCHDEDEAIAKILRRLQGGNPGNVANDRIGKES